VSLAKGLARRLLLLLLFSSLSLGLSASSGGALGSIIDDALSPTVRYQNSTEGVSLELPPGWRKEERATENGYWAAWADEEAQAASPDRSPHPGRGAKIELQVLHLLPEGGIDAQLEQGVGEAAQVLSRGKISLGGVEAYFLETRSRFDEGEDEARARSVSFVHGGRWYILTLAIFNEGRLPPGAVQRYQRAFDQAVRSLRVGRPPVAGAQAAPNFLRLPANQNLTVQQGWYYTNGGLHRAIDYVDGPLDRPASPFPVVAAYDGYAVYVVGDGWNGGLGQYVRIRHNVNGQTFYTTYAHLSGSPLPVGATVYVRRGQRIGTAGNTGYVVPSWFTHLHFVLEDGSGRRLDPYGIYNVRSYYPRCSGDHFWAVCPPTYTLPRVTLDVPGPGAVVRQPFLMGGWALDQLAPSVGIDYVHIWAYPARADGAVTGGPVFLGAAQLGGYRPDVGNVYGRQFDQSGFNLVAGGLPDGFYHLVVYARSATGLTVEAHRVVYALGPAMHVDVPTWGQAVRGPFLVGGWAIDRSSSNGAGIDYVHIWAYPARADGAVTGGPVFLGAAQLGGYRPDVGNVYGRQFDQSGFNLVTGSLPPGYWRLIVYAKSALSGRVIEQHRLVYSAGG